METILRALKREVFSISTIFLIGVPLIMGMSGPDGGKDKIVAQMQEMGGGAMQVVKTITPDEVQTVMGGLSVGSSKAIKLKQTAVPSYGKVRYASAAPAKSGGYRPTKLTVGRGPIFLGTL